MVLSQVYPVLRRVGGARAFPCQDLVFRVGHPAPCSPGIFEKVNQRTWQPRALQGSQSTRHFTCSVCTLDGLRMPLLGSYGGICFMIRKLRFAEVKGLVQGHRYVFTWI